MTFLRRATILLLAAFAVSCAPEEDRLSSWGIFDDGAAQVPVEGVLPYEIVSPLFSDYAAKHRFIQLPEGGQITYSADGDWEYPIGTVLVKTFGFMNDLRDPSAGERIIETRLLVREEDGDWESYVYLWDEDGTDAVRTPAGARVDVEWIHTDGETRSITYRVPNEVQCVNCHGGRDPVSPIGPRAEQLDMVHDYGDGPVNQIDRMAALGWFANDVPPAAERAPLADPMGDGAIDARGRAYLDANCAHCHNETGAAAQSGLWLNAHITDPIRLGICKRPVAAGPGAGGRTFDVVPGFPDESVMIYRMESEEPGIKMPELPSVLSHAEGVEVIRAWIANMEPTGCD